MAITVGLPVALAFIMFSLGIGLTYADFVRVATRPRDFMVGAICQIILLPVVAFLLVAVWPLAPELALGVMIIAAAPGGVTSNILTAIARGDVALSISLTAVISLLSVITVPVIVVLSHDFLVGTGATGELSITSTAVQVFAIVALPVLIGLQVRRWAPDAMSRLEPVARKISVVLFILVIAGAIYQERANVVTYFAQAGPVTLVLNVLMMALAWFVAKAFASGPGQQISISIECGLQNGTLAITVGTLLFGGGAAIIPAATYSLIMFGTALLFVWWLRRSVSVA